MGLLSWALCSLVFADGTTITLKDEAFVQGPVVLLGDVATIEGDSAATLANVEVGAAASPGNATRVNAALVRARVESVGFDPEDVVIAGPRSVTAMTLHLDITREMIAEDLRNFVEASMPWNLDDAIINVFPPPKDYVVPMGDVEFRWHTNPQYTFLGTGAFQGEVLVDGSIAQRFYGKASVEAFGPVVVAGVDIARGEKISGRNVRLEKRALSTIETGAYFDLEEVNGLVSKSNFLPGQVVTARKVMPPKIISRNDAVVVQATVGAVTVQSRARAMHDAAAGDILVCSGTDSKDRFEGVVRSDGVVVVD